MSELYKESKYHRCAYCRYFSPGDSYPTGWCYRYPPRGGVLEVCAEDVCGELLMTQAAQKKWREEWKNKRGANL